MGKGGVAGGKVASRWWEGCYENAWAMEDGFTGC